MCVGDGFELEEVKEVRQLVQQKVGSGKRRKKRNVRARERVREEKRKKREEKKELAGAKKRRIKRVLESDDEA